MRQNRSGPHGRLERQEQTSEVHNYTMDIVCAQNDTSNRRILEDSNYQEFDQISRNNIEWGIF